MNPQLAVGRAIRRHRRAAAIEQDAARMAEKRGQQYEVSACGQTVTLGK